MADARPTRRRSAATSCSTRAAAASSSTAAGASTASAAPRRASSASRSTPTASPPTPRCRAWATTRCSSWRRCSSGSAPASRATTYGRAARVPRGDRRADGDEDAAAALERVRAVEPRLAPLLEPMLGVSLAPTRVLASEKINVIPSTRRAPVDCRVPPGLGEEEALRRIQEVLGEDGYRLELTEQVVGNRSPIDSPLTDFIERVDRRAGSGRRLRAGRPARASPTRGPSATPSRSAPPTGSSPTATQTASRPTR